MAVLRTLGHLIEPAAGVNKAVNLADRAIGTAGQGVGIVAANPNGPLGATVPADGSSRGIVVTVDNRLGTADAYLIRPEEIPVAVAGTPPGNETANQTAWVFPSGQITQFSAFDLLEWDLVLEMLAGAAVIVTVQHTGGSW